MDSNFHTMEYDFYVKLSPIDLCVFKSYLITVYYCQRHWINVPIQTHGFGLCIAWNIIICSYQMSMALHMIWQIVHNYWQQLFNLLLPLNDISYLMCWLVDILVNSLLLTRPFCIPIASRQYNLFLRLCKTDNIGLCWSL